MGRKPLLEKKKGSLSVYVGREVLKEIAARAKAQDRSLSYIASSILTEAVKKPKGVHKEK